MNGDSQVRPRRRAHLHAATGTKLDDLGKLLLRKRLSTRQKKAEVHGNGNSAENTVKTQVLSQGGAESGALVAQTKDGRLLVGSQDGGLLAVVEAWSALPESIKARILAMIQAVGDGA